MPVAPNPAPSPLDHPAGDDDSSMDSVESLIFVDVDGVLNVGVREDGQRPVSFNTSNVARALRVAADPSNEAERTIAERLTATHGREVRGGEDGATYAQFVADMRSGISSA